MILEHNIMETNCAMAEKIFTALSEIGEFIPTDANVYILCLKVTDLAEAAAAGTQWCEIASVLHQLHKTQPGPAPTLQLWLFL